MQEFTTSLAEDSRKTFEPNVSGLLRFHRGQDGYCTLHRKPTEDTFENLGAFFPRELEEIFPSMREELERDSFFSVNAYKYPQRKTKNLRYLNSCFLDLDCHSLTPSEALGKTVTAMGQRTIPPASIFGLSGRGIWLFWLLRDVTEPGPQRAFPEKRILFARIQKALYQRVKESWPELKPDANALDAVRVTRIPGSINGKSGTPVLQFASLTPDGKQRFYTLPELADFLGLEEKRPAAKILRFGRRLPKRRNGWLARWQKALRWFETLRDTRDGSFALGCRNNAAFIYALLLRRNGLSESVVIDRVAELGRQCLPPLSELEIFGAVVSTQSLKATVHLSTARMSTMLHVTPQEAEALAPLSPKARAPRGKKRSARIEARRGRIVEILAALGGDTTAQEISEILQAEGFPGGGRSNVALDLEALELTSRKRRPRTRKRESQAVLWT